MALTENFTFRLSDTGVVLNSSTVGLPFVDITKVIGLDNADYRETMRDHEGVDGGFLDAEFEKGRELVLEGTIYADPNNMEPYLDSLKANFAPSSVLVPFYLLAPGVTERVLFVKPRGCKYDWDTLRRIGSAAAQFKMFAEDPRIYTSSQNNVVIAQSGLATTGRGYSKGYSYSYGATVAPSSANCPNSGNRDTPCTLTMTGPVTNPTIVNVTDSSTLRFLITLGASDTLVVDTQYHTVYLNGASARYSLVDPNWFFLHTGDNFISYQADSAGSSVLTVAYRSAWR